MKFILKFIGATLLAVVLLVVFAGGGLVKYMVNYHGKRLTGLEMSVAGAELNVLGGQLVLNNVLIKNPVGYQSPHAMTVASIQVNVQPKTLFEGPVMVDYIGVKGTRVAFEGNLNRNNVQDIQRILDSRHTGEDGHGHDVATDGHYKSYASDKGYVVRQFQVQDTEVAYHLGIEGVDAVSLPIDDIELANLGSKDHPLTSGALVDRLLMPLFDRLHSASLRALTDPQGLVDQIGEKLRGLFK